MSASLKACHPRSVADVAAEVFLRQGVKEKIT
jgi:hypothetical protein